MSVWCRLWCSVSNDQGYHRRLGSEWAYCREDCPRNITENCKSKGKVVDPHFIDHERQTFDYVEYEAMTHNITSASSLTRLVTGRRLPV